MAKSARGELKEILELEERAARDIERAQKKRAQLLAPLSGKLNSVFAERVNLFLSENIERVTAMKFDKSSVEKEVDVMLAALFPPVAQPRGDTSLPE